MLNTVVTGSGNGSALGCQLIGGHRIFATFVRPREEVFFGLSILDYCWISPYNFGDLELRLPKG